MNGYINEIWRYIDHMSSAHWMWVLIGVMVLGGIALRGFGSRSRY
jgi:hypothetical protein